MKRFIDLDFFYVYSKCKGYIVYFFKQFIIIYFGDLLIWIFVEIYLNNFLFEIYYFEIMSYFYVRSQRLFLEQIYVFIFKGVNLMLRKIRILFIKYISL